MKKLLTLKHWQLVSIIVLPVILFFTSPLAELIAAICGMLFLLWIFSIGYYGYQKVRALGIQPMNLKLFQLNILLLPILLLLSKLTLSSRETSNLLNIFEMILGLYSAFAAFQVLLFAGKTLAESEYKRKVKFSEYVINSIQIIVFIFGVWNLQPKVNRQLGESA